MKQLLVVKAIARVDVAALEVEDVDELAQEIMVLKDGSQQQVEQLNLSNADLLRDLNEAEMQIASVTPKERVSRRYRRLLFRRQSKDERSD